MAGKYTLILLLAVLAGCAQVGRISGGEEDVHAPKPLVDEMTPKNASTNFAGNSLSIPFDEYFKLNKPGQSILMVPPHAKVNASVQRKTLTLSWDESLEPNTTYAIYLNGTVKDVTENNDTTRQFVFSTGDQIDSISYGLPLIDAFTQEPLSNLTVVLSDPETGKLVSFGKSKDGIAQLNYLQSGTYTIRAFEDENLDLELQPNERVGFPDGGTITIDTPRFDSIPMRIFEPTQKLLFKDLKFNAPGTFQFEASERPELFEITGVFIDDISVDPWKIKENTIHFICPFLIDEPSAKVVINTLENGAERSDTLVYRFKKGELETPIRITPEFNGVLDPEHFPNYELNAQIIGIDTTMISAINLEDSSNVALEKEFFSGNKYGIRFNRENIKTLQVNFKEGAFNTFYGPSSAYTSTVSIGDESDFGTFVVDVSSYSSPVIVELLSRGEVIQQQQTNGSDETLNFTSVPPGSYSFRVIHDTNNNGIWDVGNVETLTQPELVDVYSKTLKVRANWSVEVPLKPNITNE